MKTFLAFLLLSTAAYGEWYSDVDMLAMQLQSPVPGTDYNDVEFAERVELGYHFEECGLRVRYFHFDNTYLANIGPPELDIRFKFNVLDMEVTKQYGDFTISGGFRVADWGLGYNGYTVNNIVVTPTAADATEFGVTIAADGNTGLCGSDDWQISGVYGARLSLLEGDWHLLKSNHNTAFDEIGQYRSDTVDVLEAHAGVEARYGRAFARTELEMQRWESNAFARRGWMDTGLLGIGTTVGVCF